MINTADLTTVDLEGDGVFDVLMRTASLHLEREFDANRIRGNDYAEVYLGMMQGVMAASISYATQKALTEAQTAKVEAETTNVIAQLPNIQLQDDLTTAQIAGTTAETANTVAQLPAIQLADDKIQAEILFLGAQRDLLDNQTSKVEAEKELLEQKKTTESAQTQDNIAGSDSVIGRQLSLYAAQTKGYDVDQKVKVGKLFADSANLQLNINDNYDTGSNGLNDAAINAAVTTARTSV